jgi:rare lipoprotein A
MHPVRRRGLALALAALVLAMLLPASCGPSPKPAPQRVVVTQPADPEVQRGKASWYGRRHHGGATASGERFNMHAMTAAHRKFPFGTRVRVTNLKNGRSVIVRINDRGPFGKGRVIDVSEAAAKELQMIDAGVVPCTVERLR